jgi:hypothetical protein
MQGERHFARSSQDEVSQYETLETCSRNWVYDLRMAGDDLQQYGETEKTLHLQENSNYDIQCRRDFEIRLIAFSYGSQSG